MEKQILKRILAWVLTFAMVSSMFPATAFAKETSKSAECIHNHDENCGYVAAVEEVPCDKECTDTDGDGLIDHADECAYTPAVQGQPCTHVHDESCGGLAKEQSEEENEATIDDSSNLDESFHDLIALLSELKDPTTYLADGIANESIIDDDQLVKARVAADEWFADEKTDSYGSAQEKQQLQSLILRLEGLEHIRDIDEDCPDVDCPYHYPEIIQEQLAQDETPKLLTLDDLVEDYGVEPPMQTFSRLRSEAAPHPQTLMLTEDNENNSHTGSSDGDIDVLMRDLKGTHPIEVSFTLNELPTQSAYLAVKAYDVDEDYGETDYVYINDDIFLPKDKTNSDKQRYHESTIGYLSGTNNTWNTTILSIPLEKLKVGKNTISVTIASGWVVKVDWMQLVLDGGVQDSNIGNFSLKLSDASTSGDNVCIHSSVEIEQSGNAQYTTEYTLTQNATGNALDACFGTITSSEAIELSMPLSSPSGIYTITGILKESATEAIKATDSISFYFTQGVGLGPKISHTLTPDTLTNQDVTINVSAAELPEAGITNINIQNNSKTVPENGTYDFTITYTQNGTQRNVPYTVKVDNIDKQRPTITYSTIEVLQDEAYDAVQKLFVDALSVSDNVKLASDPFSYTIPQDISNTSGTKTIVVTARDAAGNTATESCTINVIAKPVKLTMETPAQDSYTLTARLDNGSDHITETGFVWGVMPNPTLDLNNGSVKTSSVIQETGKSLTGTATGLLSGVEYYARAYAIVTENGNTNIVYSNAVQFGFGIPQYGTFSVSGVSDSTFTITRTGGTDGEQTVYYRTVNGSAIGGTHFTHQADTLTFKDGETSKTVTVTELGVTSAYNNDAGTQYSNADRTYSLEIYRVEGGGAIDQENRSKIRTMAKSDSYTIDRSFYNDLIQNGDVAQQQKHILDRKSDQGAKDNSVNFTDVNRDGVTNWKRQIGVASLYGDSVKSYLDATNGYWLYRFAITGHGTSNQGYQDIWFGYQQPPTGDLPLNDATKPSGLPGQIWFDIFDFTTSGCRAKVLGNTSLVKSISTDQDAYSTVNPKGYAKNDELVVSYNGSNYGKLEVTQDAWVCFSAHGKDEDDWYIIRYQEEAILQDANEPTLLGVAPMADGTYLPGDPITVALVFDEIVDSQNSKFIQNVTITTNVGTLRYAGGADTNVLYFTGTVTSTVNLSALEVTGINNSSYIKDMCSLAGDKATFTSSSSNVIVDATKPNVTITPVTSGSLPQHQATITAPNATALQYTWTKETTLPAYGWSDVTSGTELTESRGAAGATETWYLHVLATSSSGATTHKYQSFTFQQPNITEVSVREGTSTSYSDVADEWKPYKYIVVTYAGAQTSDTTLSFAGPQTSLQNITAASGTKYLQVTKNGTYTVTLTDDYGSVISKTIEVKKIDADTPTVTLRSGNSTEKGTVYNSLSIAVLPEDAGGSGLTEVEYAWTNAATEPTTWNTLTAASDGSYQAVYTATETTKTAKYLHVKVTDGAGNVSSVVTSGPYQVIKKATGNALPTITVTGNPTTWAKSADLTWTVTKGTGAIETIYTPDGSLSSTNTTGNYTVTKNGIYSFTVIDANGNSASAEVNVTNVDSEAPKLTSLTAQANHTNGTITLSGVTDNCTVIYDSNGNYSSISGSGIKSRQYKLEGTSTWNNFTADNISVSKNGTYIIKLTDELDNSREYSVKMDGIDATAPNVTCTINATANTNSGWYTTPNLPVVLDFADEAGTEGGTPSGIKSVLYKWVTSNTTKPTNGLTSVSETAIGNGTVTTTLSNNGTWYLYYKATDNKGNVTEGFSNEIKKDTFATSFVITGPSVGQPISSGLAMNCQVTYGPSGGRITGGLSADSATKLAEFGQSTGTDSRTTTVNYTTKTAGINYFRFYIYASNGATGTDTHNSWPFYVRQIAFDSQNGSSVEPQLVWYKNDSSTELVCAVTKPSDPTRFGYTFGGWYTDAACTDGKQFDFANTQVKEDTTLYAKWTPNTYTVTYHLTNPDGTAYTPGVVDKTYTYGQGLTLPVPSKEGFVFSGWYDNDNYGDTKYTVIGGTETGNKVYYAYYKDVTKPLISVSADGYLAGEDGWWRNDSSKQVKLAVTYSDNVNVTALWVKVDNGAFTQITSFDPNKTFSYTSLQEGVHTYTFKVVDAAGNENTASTTMKLDTGKPEIGTITCDQKAANIFDWIIGKKSLIIHIPVTDNTSGIKTITYTQTPSGGTAETKTITLSGTTGTQTANLTLNADWKGTITNITCTDIAGNVSDSKAIEGAGNGMIVEDNAPVITITEADMSDATNPKPGNTVSENFYDENNAPTLYVAVKDDIAGETTVITAGIQSISYRVNGGTAVNVTGSFATALTGNWDFTIPLDGKTGLVNVEVTAVDYAGNTANSSVVVKIKGKEATPEAQLNYQKNALTNLVPGAKYEITIAGEESGSNATITYTADENGEILLIIKDENNNSIDLCGKTIAIVRKGDGTNSSDSNAQNLSMAARPEAPSATKTDETIKGKKDGTLTGVDTTMEYSVDGGNIWTTISENSITGLGSCEVQIREEATTSSPHGEVQTVTIAEGRTLTVAFESNGGSGVSSITGKSWNDTVDKPENPTKEGYAFEGWYQDSNFNTIWNFASNKLTGDVTLYAKWRDNVKPNLSAALSDGENGQKWHNTLFFTLTYSDNVGVTKLYVKTDNADYAELDISKRSENGTDTNGNSQYQLIFDGLKEGSHTYTFKAVDAAGNEKETAAHTAKLDTTRPVLGESSFNEGYRNLWDWIIRKDSLIITIPVTETGSGIETVTYTLMPENGQTEEKTATLYAVSGGSDDYEAKIYIAPDFKGRVAIESKDKAGNVSLSKTIGTDGNGIKGILVEDNAPEITILADRGITDVDSTSQSGTELSTGYYNSAPKLLVTVEDDDNNAISGGLKSCTWKLDNSAVQNVSEDFNASMKTQYGFTINELQGKTGTFTVTVNTMDQAGNTAESSVTVKIKAKELIPNPSVDYLQEKLTGLVSGATYVINGENITADEQGNIVIKEAWFGNTIKISRLGGTTTLESDKADVAIAARPEAPSATKTDETIKGKKDGTLTGVDTTMEYSVDGGNIWTSINESNITEGRITGLRPCTIQIRKKATESASHGEVQSVTIVQGRALTVIFESNGGSDVSSITGKSWNEIVDKPEDPTKEGYAFEGWYQDSIFNTIWDFPSDKLADDVTLYAKWTAAVGTSYKVRHYTEDLTDNTWILQETENKTGTSGADITLAEIAKSITGFTYKEGKVNDSVVASTTILADGSREIDLYYSRNTYTLTLNKGTGISDVTGAGSYKYGQSVLANAEVSIGHAWKNWTGTKTSTDQKFSFTMPASNVAMTANATINQYIVTFNANGHGTAPGSQTVNYGDKATEPVALTETGYTFGGWYKEDACKNKWEFTADKVTSNTTFYAKWIPITYTVAYNGNGHTSGSTTSSSHTYDASKNLTANGFTKTGYVFAGWATSASGSVAYADKASVKNLSTANGATVNLYAKWDIHNYTIGYTLNGGSVATANPTSYNITSAAITLNNPTRTGYTFKGWTGSNGSTAQASVTIASGSTGDKSYTANWTPASYSITYNLNGGTGASNSTYTIESSTITLPTPSKTGYTFNGWYTASDFSGSAVTQIAQGSTGDKTFYAKWTLNEPSVTLTADGGTTNPVTGVIESVYNNSNTLIALMAKTSHSAAPEGSSSNITYTYQWYRDGQVLTDMDSTVGSLALKNVNQSGTYTVKVTAKDEEGRTSEAGSSNGVIVNIAKAPLTFTVAENTHSYDATAKTASVEQTAGQTPHIDADRYEVIYEQNGKAVSAPTDAGTYDVIVNLKDNNFSHFGQSDSVTKQKVGELIIKKKQVTAVWTNLTAEYNGSAQAPECSTLVGLMEADAEDVFAGFTAGQRLTNAGTKRLTATLEGTRAYNYQLTNAEVNFTVQKAPVTFAVADHFVQADGHAHKATVSAYASGERLDASKYTITYRNAAGQTVDEPTDAGNYGIYAKLTDANYRHSGTADGTACQIGVLSIYQNQTAKTYTVEYAKGASEVTGNLPAEQTGISEGTLIYLPEKGTLSRTGYAFTGWILNGKQYQPGETFTMPAKNVTITACWKEATYRISGVVDQEGKPLPHVVVTLKRGAEIIGETTTDTAGKYSFVGVIPGLYNLVTSYDGITTTVKVLIVDTDAEQNATLPAGRTNSILDVMAGAPTVVVGNLEKLFQISEGSNSQTYPEIYTDNDKNVVETGGTVEIRLTVEKVAEPDQTGANLLKEAMQKLPEAFDYQPELYLDLVLQKTVYPAEGSGSGSDDPETETLSDSHVILESVISLPSNLQSRRFYKVYRIHQNEQGDILLQELTTQPNAEGEYYELNPENTELTIHARKYSVYTVAASDYVAPQPEKPESSGGAQGHPDNVALEEEKVESGQVNKKPLEEEQKLPEESDPEAEKTEESPEEIPVEIPEDTLPEQEQLEEPMPVGRNGKSFVVLNVLLTLLSLVMAVRLLLGSQERRRKIAGLTAAAASLSLLLLTLGFGGVLIADLRTILFTLLAAITVFMNLTGTKQDKE